MSLIWHPDKHNGKDTEEEATEKFGEINSAYKILCEGLEKGRILFVCESLSCGLTNK